MHEHILITGGSGMIGSQIPFGIKPSKAELDITDPASVARALDTYKPTHVLHLAALTDMKLCEEQPALAHTINVIGTKHIADACSARGIPLIYMSTCAVFDGTKQTPYIESDTTGAISVYGKTKQQGEAIVLTANPHNLVIRTGWLFGGGAHDKKFVKMFYEKFKAGETITAVSDRYGSPTYIADLLEKIWELISTDTTGTYHVVNNGCVSYYDVAKEIQQFGHFTNIVESVLYTNLPQSTIPRGNMEALASEKISLRPWDQAVHEYLK